MKNSKEQISLSAKNYANALVDVVNDNKSTYVQISDDFQTIQEILDMSPELRDVLINPTVSFDLKIDIIEEIFKKEVSETMMNFLKVLIEKKRFKEFSQIHRAYINKLNEIHNIQPVTVVSAVELSETDKLQVIKKLETKLNKTVRPEWQLDNEIIAGLIIKIDDDIIDMSIRNRLAKLKKDITLR